MPNKEGDEFAVGFNALMGDAWWRGDGSTAGTHHDEMVPLERVYELVGFEPIWTRLSAAYAGDEFAPWMITHPKSGYLLGVNGPDYPTTDYEVRLIDNVARILDQSEGELVIGSAGILSGGRQAFIQIALGDPAVHAATGEKFTQWLMAYSSLDGTLQNSYQKGCTRALCRNTFQAFRSEAGTKYAYRNTKFSGLNLGTARSILNVFQLMGTDLFAQMDRELAIPVSGKQWEAVKEEVYPTVDQTPKNTVIHTRYHATLDDLYNSDDRVGSTGTYWGAFQAFSTFQQHHTSVQKKHTLMGRNMRWVMSGSGLTQDQKFQTALDKVLATV